MTPSFEATSRAVASPSFSVVIPLYNKRAFIRRTLDTVLAQTWPAAEVIVVDDSSTDGGAEEVADLLCGRVRMVRQPNAGPGPARNRGAALATAEWIALIDADDLWHPQHLENLAGTIAAFPHAAVVTAGSRWQAEGRIDLGLPEMRAAAPRLFNYFRDTIHGQVHTSSLAIRRSVFLSSGGFGAFVPGEDMEFWTRLALDNEFAASPVPTSIYVRGNDGLMESDRRQFAEVVDIDASPFMQLVDRALTDDRYLTRRREIAAFADRVLMQSAKNFLYAGNPRGARLILQRLRGKRTPMTSLYWAATALPGPALFRAARAYSTIKRLSS